jgi:hypothetical protein
MSYARINIHIFDKAKYKTYEEARSENAIYNYDASHCDDQWDSQSSFDGGLLYDTMAAMSMALEMIEQADRLGAVLVVDGSIVDRWGN